jgi:ATP-dependent DNA ligase I
MFQCDFFLNLCHFRDAHEAFNSSRQIEMVLDSIIALREAGNPNGSLEVGASLMTPVQPMLAAACKSVDMAFDKCPNGMYSEIKYDGERVQLHKNKSSFKYFSRSLKPVLPHKVAHFKDHIPKAFPDASDLIIDAEVLMVNNTTGNPLPFGTLGVHKAAGFKDATPCLFVFDILYYNGENLMDKPIKSRKKLLHEAMVEVGNNVKFSETKVITKKFELSDMIKDVLNQGLEGLVLKDLKSPYEPGKRHWLKVKKDYLNEGAMADSADLVVLGAWYGSGNRGGAMSIFLMGCHDKDQDKWCTVTKVHTGHDDETLERLQKELAPNMLKIKQDYNRVPEWLDCSRQMTPDFVAKDPKLSPVWEITGAEFSKAELHSAAGISIRFPRVTKIRDDKTCETATSLKELKVLFETSKQATDIDLDYVGKAEDLLMKTPTKKRRSSESSSPVSVVKQKSDLSAAPAPMAAKSPKVENESIKVTLGASKRSFDKVGIKSIETGFELNVIRGDLFKTSTDKTCLAHCVSRDLKMNKGIAKLFRDKFGRIGELEKSKSDIGDVAVLKDGNRYIYNLVTKDKYNGFPTYETLRQSLVSMRNHALKNNVKEIAMPKLACGLDKLNWSAVRTLIKNVFFDDKIKITVYHLDNDATTTKHKVVIDEDVDEGPSSTKKPKKNEKKHSYPILDIAEGNLTPITDDQKKNNNDENSDTKSGKKTKCVALKYETLPDVFLGDKIFLQNGVQNEGKMKRYIISYGGEVVDELEFSDANVVVKAANVDQKKPLVNGFGLLAKKKAPQVTEKWLLDSIMSQKRQPLNNYHV